MNCIWTEEMISLLSTALECAKEREFFSAGMWVHEAVRSRNNIADERKKKLADKLIEAVYGAIETAERRQTQKVITATMYRMRGASPSGTFVPA